MPLALSLTEWLGVTRGIEAVVLSRLEAQANRCSEFPDAQEQRARNFREMSVIMQPSLLSPVTNVLREQLPT